MLVALGIPMLRQSLNSKQVSAQVLPLAYLVNRTRILPGIIFSVIVHSKSLCSRLHIQEADILPWRRKLIREIKERLNEREGSRVKT